MGARDGISYGELAILRPDGGGGIHILQYDQGETRFQADSGGSFITFRTNTGGSLTEKVRIANNGNVGIGTTDPEGILHTQTLANYSFPTFDTYSSNINQHSNFRLRKSNQDSVGHTATSDGTNFGSIGFFGNNGNKFVTGAYIDAKQEGTAGANHVPTALRFATSDGNEQWQERMRITSTGNVGIGTDQPITPLEVIGRTCFTDSIKEDNKFLLATFSSGEDRFEIVPRKGDNTGWDWDKKVAIYRNGNAYIATGSLGIGTASPGNDKLDVRGRCYSSGGWHITNADYAEYFESADGSAIPVGTPVVLTKNGKIRPAKKGETPIGIITINPAIVGNSYKEWPKKYLRNEFGNLDMEDYEEEVMIPKKEKITRERQKMEKKKIIEVMPRIEIVLEEGKYIQKEISESLTREIEEAVFEEVDLYDKTGQKVIGKHKVPVMETYEEEIKVLDENDEPILLGSGEFVAKKRPKLNPDFDESKQYIPREDRSEWNCVGLLGQLHVRKGQPVAPSWVKIKDISDKVELWLVK